MTFSNGPLVVWFIGSHTSRSMIFQLYTEICKTFLNVYIYLVIYDVFFLKKVTN